MIELKKAITIEEQIALLKSRGMHFGNEALAKKLLSQIGYYRLSGYNLNFYKNPGVEDLFQKGVTFEEVIQSYLFDKELKGIFFQLFQTIEVRVRSYLILEISIEYGADGWKNINLFVDENEQSLQKKEKATEDFERFQQKMSSELARSRETFIIHHHRKYNSQFPVWVVAEIMSFGNISKLYKNMRTQNKKAIAKNYFLGSHYTFIQSWLEKIVNIRNICCHHNRLINRELACGKKTPAIKKYDAKGIFAYLLFIRDHFDIADDYAEFINDLEKIFKKYPSVTPEVLDLPANWLEILKV